MGYVIVPNVNKYDRYSPVKILW